MKTSPRSALGSLALLVLATSACPETLPNGGGDSDAGASGDLDHGGPVGDGDGDAATPGDGDGDGDGDAAANPGDGDGDGDSAANPGDGDGDGDSAVTPGDGDGDSAVMPGDGDGDGDGDTGTPAKVVRFVALGDTGEGNDEQYMVSSVIEDVCLAQGCDFALLLGDNFYDEGVSSVDDPQWQEKFELPYANLDFLFYPVLGNHDGGLFGAGVQLSVGNNQVDYSASSEKWTMPSRWYRHDHEHVSFFAIDTSAVFFEGLGGNYADMTDEQADWLDAELPSLPATSWRIVYGHHPYISNGPHGNAGDYDGLGGGFLNIASGEPIKYFIEDHVCGKADLYLCGHDHSRQWHVATCDGTSFMVSGAGAKTTSIDNPDQAVNFQDADTPGFAWFEIEGDTLTVQWWDMHGNMSYEGSLNR